MSYYGTDFLDGLHDAPAPQPLFINTYSGDPGISTQTIVCQDGRRFDNVPADMSYRDAMVKYCGGVPEIKQVTDDTTNMYASSMTPGDPKAGSSWAQLFGALATLGVSRMNQQQINAYNLAAARIKRGQGNQQAMFDFGGNPIGGSMLTTVLIGGVVIGALYLLMRRK